MQATEQHNTDTMVRLHDTKMEQHDRPPQEDCVMQRWVTTEIHSEFTMHAMEQHDRLLQEECTMQAMGWDNTDTMRRLHDTGSLSGRLRDAKPGQDNTDSHTRSPDHRARLHRYV